MFFLFDIIMSGKYKVRSLSCKCNCNQVTIWLLFFYLFWFVCVYWLLSTSSVPRTIFTLPNEVQIHVKRYMSWKYLKFFLLLFKLENYGILWTEIKHSFKKCAKKCVLKIYEILSDNVCVLMKFT